MSPFSKKKGARSEVTVGAKDGDSKMATLQPKDGKATDNNASVVSDAKDIRHDRIVYEQDGRRRRGEEGKKKKGKDEELKGWKATMAIEDREISRNDSLLRVVSPSFIGCVLYHRYATDAIQRNRDWEEAG
ncbi:hypothetical protein CSOJ01_09457 [Colletotrichum sojae]|uniref:Uncharacterized protein n=1 Tax=Colletotrichum sojae TaxID=2175907 RepID=A0A8H6J2Y4_9PEZI|nr:hypothetical protein CSOJ01_09457 [Colletotrichum sojae]